LAQEIDYEQWWQLNVVSGKYYTIKQFKTILSGADSRRAYLDIVKTGNRVLDAGCGLGLDYEFYCKNNLEVDYTGIDTCAGFIEYCRKTYLQGRFEVYPSYATPYADKTFDIATIRHVLEHLKEPYSTIKELCRIAKKVAIIWFIPPSEEKIRLTKKGFYKNIYSKCKLKTYIAELGWTVSIRDIPIKSSKKHQLWLLTL